ncbi:MAG: methyltransferase domain-containing protein, partial [Pseudomonadota bacterium]
QWARRLDPMVAAPSRGPRTCPICSYSGPFLPAGLSPRPDARCPRCGSLERHRVLKTLVDRSQGMDALGRVLHFAPETFVEDILRPLSTGYVTTDLFMPNVDQRLNIEKLDLEDASFDTVICIHVLEHVSDAAALPELLRVLRPGGTAVLDVPIAWSMDETYENEAVTSETDRLLHFGQPDHVRMYGRDFADRVAAAGFEVEHFTIPSPDAIGMGIGHGARMLLARRPQAVAA